MNEKQETMMGCGDCAKMREALKTVKRYLDGYTVNVLEMRRQVDAALAAPPRNCDVGTAEEEAERYMNFCHNYPKCTGCPCVGRMQYHKCEFAWAQLPYEKGGAK